MKDIKYWKNTADYPQYMFATNRMVNDVDYIIRTHEPRFIAEARIFDDVNIANDYVNNEQNLTVMADGKYSTFVVTIKEFWFDTSEYSNEVIKGITKKLAQWYKQQHYNNRRRRA